MSWKFLLSTLVIATAFFSEVVAGYQLQVSDSYAIRHLAKTNMTLEIQNEKTKMSITQKCDFTLKITELNQEGIYSAIVTLNGMSNETSDQDPQSSLFQQAIERALVGQTFEVTFTSTGNVLKISHFDLPARLYALIPEGPNKKVVCEVLNATVGEKAMQTLLDSLLTLYASKAQPWKKTIDILPGLQVEKRVTLGACGENPHEIPFTMELSLLLPNSKNFLGLQGFALAGKGRGKGTGSLSLDPVTGWCYFRTQTETFSGTLQGKMEGMKVRVPMNCTITQTTKSHKLD